MGIDTFGERWRKHWRTARRGLLPGMHHLRFAKAVNNRYARVGSRFALVRAVVEAQQDALQDWVEPWPVARSPVAGRVSARRRDERLDGEFVDSVLGRLPAADDPGTAGAEKPAPPSLLRGPAQYLEPNVERRLANVLDLQIPRVKIHTGLAADQFARHMHADAVSYGDHILFRAGRYAPDTQRGLALLGHELTHAAHARLARGAPQDDAARAREESVAIRNEQRILDLGVGRVPPPATIPSGPQGAGGEPVPQAAATDRTITPAEDAPPPPADAHVLSSELLKAIKDEVYADLMDRVRTDFERGA